MIPDLATALLAGAAGGVAQEWARVAAAAAGKAWRGESEGSQEEALRNVQSLVALLARRTAEMEEIVGSQEAIRERLIGEARNPDFSFTVQQALLAAARTNNPARHEILARAVVERLLAAPDSIQGVASAAAVEALGRLSATHLELLGLAAMIYYVGPRVRAPLLPEGLAGADSHDYQTRFKAEQAFMMPAVEAYVEWFIGCLLAYAGPAHSDLPVAASMDFAHLTSAGCITYDRALKRSATAVLTPPSAHDEINSGVSYSYHWGLEGIRLPAEVQKQWLHLWDEGLQHVTLTPSGLLIGAVVHELRCGDRVEVRWDLPLSDPFEVGGVWDGRHVNARFVDALLPELKTRIRHERLARGDDSEWP